MTTSAITVCTAAAQLNAGSIAWPDLEWSQRRLFARVFVAPLAPEIERVGGEEGDPQLGLERQGDQPQPGLDHEDEQNPTLVATEARSVDRSPSVVSAGGRARPISSHRPQRRRLC